MSTARNTSERGECRCGSYRGTERGSEWPGLDWDESEISEKQFLEAIREGRSEEPGPAFDPADLIDIIRILGVIFGLSASARRSLVEDLT